MALHTRSIKANGTTAWEDGDPILHSEHNTELDTLTNRVNGGLGDANMDSGEPLANDKLSPVANTKVLAHGTTAALLDDTTSPGDTATPSLPATLDAEIKRIRYRIAANNGYLSTVQYRESGGAMASVSWTEPPIVGRNLFPNAGFEVQSGAANSAPDGWDLVGTPSTVAIEAAALPAAGVDKRSLNIVADAVTEGISRTVTGLKPSAKYLVGVAYTLTSGEFNVTTTNALGAGDYQNLAFNDASTGASLEIFQGIVQTDATPTDVTVNFVSSVASDDFNLFYAWFYELSDAAPIEAPHIPMQTATDDAQLLYPAAHSVGHNWEEVSPLNLSQYVPHEGYRFTYEVTVCWMVDESLGEPDTDTANFQHSFRIKRDGVVVEGPHTFWDGGGFSFGLTGGVSHTHTFRHVIENPTPGTTYDFTVEIGVYDPTGTGTSGDWAFAFMNPLINGLQSVSRAKLIPERI